MVFVEASRNEVGVEKEVPKFGDVLVVCASN
jgi:hypothetical protein